MIGAPLAITSRVSNSSSISISQLGSVHPG
jgi:hypothetical protein